MISKTVSLSRPCRFLTVVLAVVFSLGLSLTAASQAPAGAASPMFAGSNSSVQNLSEAQAPAPGAQASAVATAGAPKGSNTVGQGLKVHGHWVIDIKNPDGTLAHHHEFENQLQAGGAAYLIGLISGYAVPSDGEIYVSSTGTAPCKLSGSAVQGCAIVRSLTSSPAATTCANYSCFATLTYQTSQNYNLLASNYMVWSGSAVASQAGTIDSVQTYTGTCPTGPIGTPGSLTAISPATCTATAGQYGINAFTGTTITAIPVANGQIIQVSVTISFS